MVRGKFKVMNQQVASDTLISVQLSACKDDVFGQNTPSGTIAMCIVNDVAKKLEVGKSYFVDFTEVGDK